MSDVHYRASPGRDFYLFIICLFVWKRRYVCLSENMSLSPTWVVWMELRLSGLGEAPLPKDPSWQLSGVSFMRPSAHLQGFFHPELTYYDGSCWLLT